MFARQLDEVAVHPVVAHFEVGKAGTGFFPCFEVDQELAGVLAHGQQFVQFAVVAGLEDAAIADHRRRVVNNGFCQQVSQFRVGAGDGRQQGQVRRFQLGHGVLQLGQGTKGIA
ncbi:hypothetical protein D3C78_1184040 [compost metagenome]